MYQYLEELTESSYMVYLTFETNVLSMQAVEATITMQKKSWAAKDASLDREMSGHIINISSKGECLLKNL